MRTLSFPGSDRSTSALAINGLSLIQSNFGSPRLGNLELIANESGRLVHYWCDDHPPHAWHGPFYFTDAQVSGNPALIQSRFGVRGHFELVSSAGGSAIRGLLHFRRNNDQAVLPWQEPTVLATALTNVEAVALIESNFGDPGNLEAVVRVGEELFHLWFDGSRWSEPAYFFRGAAGAPGFIQSNYGKRGNFDVVTPLKAGGMAHLWRNNDDQALPWAGPTTFGADLTERVDAVALIQNTMAAVGPGNLELAARIGNRTCHFWRKPQPPFEPPPREWHGPSTFMCETGPR